MNTHPHAGFRFYEELNDFLPPEKRKVTFDYPLLRRASVKDIIEALGVPGRVEDWRGNPLGEPLSVSGVSSFVPG